MEPGGFDELDIKVKILFAALMDTVPGFTRVLEKRANEELVCATHPLERYAAADILEFISERQRVRSVMPL